jgi:O-antigen ligase
VQISAVLCLLVPTAVFSWWGIKFGGYFGTAMLPGVLVLCAGLIALVLWGPWRGDAGISRPAKLALAGLFGLAAWSALSALWSPTPDVALVDAQRIAGYGVCFALGLWLRNLLGDRLHLVLVPLTVAAAVAGGLAAGAMLFGDDIQTYLERDGTLQYPLGYRNANAAFFAIALWPALALARTRELTWASRAAAAGVATLCVEMALLSQSRGSVPAIAIALVVFLALTRERARAVGWLVILVVPAIVVVPALSDLYSVANETSRIRVFDEMRTAGEAALGGVAISAMLALVAIALEARFPLSPRGERIANRAATGGLLAALVGGAVAFVVAVGNPIDFFEKRVDEFRTQGSPGFEGGSSRFSFDAGTERLDLWEVALDDASSAPLLGSGGGGFQFSYTENRSNAEQNAKDAHSVELEALTELGLPGLILLALAIGGPAIGAMRSRRLGPGAATVSAAALTSGTYWFAHGSIDWFWTYALVTAPVFLLLGAACAPGAARESPGAARRRWAAAGLAALILTLVPPYLSERYTNSAFNNWRQDAQRAYDDLDRARSLNPLAEEPWLAEGVIASELGDSRRAIAAFTGAVEERPEDWVGHYFLATEYLQTDTASARAELEVARELNPLSPRLRGLSRRIEAAEEAGSS